MAKPWEEFGGTSTDSAPASGPWSDFKTPESPDSKPWEKFQPLETVVEPAAAEQGDTLRADNRNFLQRFADSRRAYYRNWWQGLKESTATGVDYSRAEPFRKEVRQGTVTGSLEDHWKMGGWSAALNNRVSAAAMAGNTDELRAAIKEDRDVLSAVGDKMDLSKAGLLERGFKGAAESGVPMVESAGLGAFAGAVPFAGAVTGRAAVGAYWQQQGAGQFLRSFLRGKDVDAIDDGQLKEYNRIAQTLAVPYAAVEFAVSAVPGMKELGSSVDQQVANFLFRKAMQNPTVLKSIAKHGTSFGIRWALESLFEEGTQGTIEEGAGEMLDSASQGDQKSIMQLVRSLDPGKLKKAFWQSGVESVPAVGVITLAGGGAAGVRNRLLRGSEAAGETAPGEEIPSGGGAPDDQQQQPAQDGTEEQNTAPDESQVVQPSEAIVDPFAGQTGIEDETGAENPSLDLDEDLLSRLRARDAEEKEVVPEVQPTAIRPSEAIVDPFAGQVSAEGSNAASDRLINEATYERIKSRNKRISEEDRSRNTGLSSQTKEKRAPSQAQLKQRAEFRRRAQPIDQALADFRKNYPRIRTPEITDPVYQELMGKSSKEPGIIPRRFFKHDSNLESYDELLQTAHREIPHIITADDLGEPSALAKIYGFRIETVGQRESMENREWSERAEADIFQRIKSRFESDIEDGIFPPENMREKHPDAWNAALKSSGVDESTLINMEDEIEIGDDEFNFDPEELEQESSEQNSGPAVKAVNPRTGQTEFIDQNEGGFKLTGERQAARETFADRQARETAAREQIERTPDIFSGNSYAESSADAGTKGEGGLGEANTPADDPNYSALPIEMPELVHLAEQLGNGKLPKIAERISYGPGRNALGVFRGAEGAGPIELRLKADVFNLVPESARTEMRQAAAIYAAKQQELNGLSDSDTARMRDEFYEKLYGEELEKRKKEDPVLARKTLAHEIGHWIDFVPQNTMKRGNILGHIAALKNYTKSLLEETPGSGNLITEKDRAALRRQAEQQLKDEFSSSIDMQEIVREVPVFETVGLKPQDVLGLHNNGARELTPELYDWYARQDRAVKKEIIKKAMRGAVDPRLDVFGAKRQVGTKQVVEQVAIRRGRKYSKEDVRRRFRELLKEEIKSRRLHELDEIKEELRGLIAWWNGTETMPDYYRKPAEMFADAFSVLMNNPQAVAKKAPKFYKAFFDHLESRPAVQKVYNEIQEDIRSGSIYRDRVKRLHEAFEKTDDEVFAAETQGQKLTRQERRDLLSYRFDRVFGPVYSRIRRSGVSGDERGRIEGSLENYLYRATGHEYYMGRVNQEVVRPLLDAGLTWEDLSEYMFHQRVINERFDMANPLGFTPKSSQQRLDEMKSTAGPQGWAALETSHLNLWAIRKETVLKMLSDSGLVTPDLLKKIEDNLFYSTFAVNQRGATEEGSIEDMLSRTYGTNVGARIFRQIGTLQKIQDPAAATVTKDLSLMDAARKNAAKVDVVDFLRQYFPNEITAAKKRWTGMRNEIVMREGDRAATLVVMRSGEAEGWYVPRVFAEAFRSGNSVENAALMRLISAPNRAIKNFYTQLNYGFWPVAFVRDVMAFKGKMPRVSNAPFGSPQFWRYFRAAYRDSKSSVFGTPTAGALESLAKQDWITVANPMANAEGDRSVDRLLARYWQDPGKIKADAPAIDRVARTFQKWMEAGQVLERTVKRAGRIYLDRNFQDMPEWRKQYIIHNYSGSPNFLQKGSWNAGMDFFALFYNPWKESLRSTGTRFAESPGTMTWNTAKYAVVPKILMFLASSGALIPLLKASFGDDGEEFGKEIQEMYSYVPEYDKTNYTVVPLGWADKDAGKVLYLRLPLAEEFRLPAGLAWKALNREVDPSGLASYAGGQLPGGSPLLEVSTAWMQFMGGRNPYDWFRGRNLLSDDVAAARDRRGVQALAKYTWNSFGGGLITRFDVADFGKDPNETGKEKFLQLPVISNALGRWLKISNRGRADTLRRKVSEPLRREQARSRLNAREALNNDDTNRINVLMGSDPRAAKYIINNMRDIYMRRSMRPEDAMIYFAPTTEEKRALSVFDLMGGKKNHGE